MDDNEVAALFDDWLASQPGASAAVEPVAVPTVDDPGAAPGVTEPETLLAALAADAVDAGARIEPIAADVSGAKRDRYLVFTVAGASYAVLETSVTEVGRIPRLTPVPRVPAWLRGVTSLRGEVLSVVDLRVLLGLDPTSLHTGRLLVVHLSDEELSLGLLVDGVDQIAGVAPTDVRPPASPLEGPLSPYLAGVMHVGDRLIAALDLDALLKSADIRQFEDRKSE